MVVILFAQTRQVPCTTIQHVGGTLHGRVGELQTVVQVHAVPVPLILCPELGVEHVDAIVVAKATMVGYFRIRVT